MPVSRVGSDESLVDRIVIQLQEMIVSGELQPGEQLPPERKLTEQLGVSRTVTREGVRILAAKGLVQTKRGVGTTVCQITRDQIVEPLSMLLQTQWGAITVEQLDGVRTMLEVEIAGLAALHASDDDLAELTQEMEALERTQDNPDSYAEADALFHRALASSTHNPLLIIIFDTVADLMRDIRRLVHRHPDLVAQTLADHRRIFETVKSGGQAEARSAMRDHLAHARSFQQATLQGHPFIADQS